MVSSHEETQIKWANISWSASREATKKASLHWINTLKHHPFFVVAGLRYNNVFCISYFFRKPRWSRKIHLESVFTYLCIVHLINNQTNMFCCWCLFRVFILCASYWIAGINIWNAMCVWIGDRRKKNETIFMCIALMFTCMSDLPQGFVYIFGSNRSNKIVQTVMFLGLHYTKNCFSIKCSPTAHYYRAAC